MEEEKIEETTEDEEETEEETSEDEVEETSEDEETTEEETSDEEESTEETSEDSENKTVDRFNREMHKAKCADCGQECEVPFKPAGDRPVYCRDCYRKHAPKRRYQFFDFNLETASGRYGKHSPLTSYKPYTYDEKKREADARGKEKAEGQVLQGAEQAASIVVLRVLIRYAF